MKAHVSTASEGVSQLKGVTSILAQAPCVYVLSHRRIHQCVDRASKGVWWTGNRRATIQGPKVIEFLLQLQYCSVEQA